ncbi:MAG: SDR family NAD(P)-dependent oxidoreductase [Pseudomonadota bacterium]
MRTAGQLFDLTGRVALVTGASSGLGRHFAKVLAANGARVAIAARRRDRLDALSGEIEASGGTALPVALDVTDAGSVASAFDVATDALGPVGIVVNNAGVPSEGKLADTDDAAWRAVLDVNLDGVFRVAREAASRMADTGGGSIINIASILGLGVTRGLGPYAVSKAAVIQLTKALAVETARDHVRVNTLAPGYFATEINTRFLTSPPGEKMRARVPMQRFGREGELDGALLLLASDAGAYMTGSTLTIDGGHTLAMA